MKRRQFIATSAWASLFLTAPPMRFAKADTGALNDKLWIFVDANGGWDPTFFCDPQPVDGFVSPGVYLPGDVQTNSGGVSYAPMIGSADPDGTPYTHYLAPWGVSPQPFFEKYANDLLVINGVDAQTNNHTVGSRNIWSGKLGEGNPALGGLIAAIHSNAYPNTLPAAFMSTGGYDRTNRLVPSTRVAQTTPLQFLAAPNLKNPSAVNLKRYHHPQVEQLWRTIQADRNGALWLEQGLPQVKDALTRLQSARDSENALAAILPVLESIPEIAQSNKNPLLEPARIALAAMKSEISVCANLSMRGFDSHANHDILVSGNIVGHRPPLQEIVEAIDYVFELAADLEINPNRLVVVVGSDFGRTRYNSTQSQTAGLVIGGGKDHWPVTSMMLISKDPLVPTGVIGGTYAGGTVGGVEAYPVKAEGSDVVVHPMDAMNDGDATLIRQVHVHHALRCLAGIKNHDLSERYPVHRQGDFPLPILPNVPGWESFV